MSSQEKETLRENEESYVDESVKKELEGSGSDQLPKPGSKRPVPGSSSEPEKKIRKKDYLIDLSRQIRDSNEATIDVEVTNESEVTETVKCVNGHFPFLINQTGGKIFVREDYKTLWKIVMDEYRGKTRALTISGQPGIGKTIALYYLLAQGIAYRKAQELDPNSTEPRLVLVLCTQHLTFIVFDGDSVKEYKTQDGGPWEDEAIPRNVIAFFDSNAQMQIPTAPFLHETSRCLIIQAASPQPRRYRGWLKEISPPGRLWLMDVWSEPEAESLLKLHPQSQTRPSNNLSPIELFRLLGPSPRHIFEELTQAEVDLVTNFSFDLSRLQQFETILQDGNALESEHPFFHNAFFAFRRTDFDSTKSTTARGGVLGLCDYSIPTRYLKNRVFRDFTMLQLEEQLKWVKSLRPIPEVAGAAFETLTIQIMSMPGLADLSYHIDGFSKNLRLSSLPKVALPSKELVFPIADVLWLPGPGFPTIDAVVVQDDGKHIIFLQSTIASKHPIEGSGISQVLALIPWLADVSDTTVLEFLFIVLEESRGKALASRKSLTVYLPSKIVKKKRVHPKVIIPVGYLVVPDKIQEEWCLKRLQGSDDVEFIPGLS